MKKVLILSVIAMLALSVMALAGTGLSTYSGLAYPAETVLGVNAYGYINHAQVGPTCQSTALVVYSEIGIEQGYVATATSFDASFCGATGEPLTAAYSDGVTGGTPAYVLAELSVESNMGTIGVSVSYAGDTAVSLLSPTTNGNNDYSGTTLTLNGINPVNSASTGTLYVYGNSSIAGWTAAGHHMLTTTFTITPDDHF